MPNAETGIRNISGIWLVFVMVLSVVMMMGSFLVFLALPGLGAWIVGPSLFIASGAMVMIALARTRQDSAIAFAVFLCAWSASAIALFHFYGSIPVKFFS